MAKQMEMSQPRLRAPRSPLRWRLGRPVNVPALIIRLSCLLLTRDARVPGNFDDEHPREVMKARWLSANRALPSAWLRLQHALSTVAGAIAFERDSPYGLFVWEFLGESILAAFMGYVGLKISSVSLIGALFFMLGSGAFFFRQEIVIWFRFRRKENAQPKEHESDSVAGLTTVRR